MDQHDISRRFLGILSVHLRELSRIFLAFPSFFKPTEWPKQMWNRWGAGSWLSIRQIGFLLSTFCSSFFFCKNKLLAHVSENLFLWWFCYFVEWELTILQYYLGIIFLHASKYILGRWNTFQLHRDHFISHEGSRIPSWNKSKFSNLQQLLFGSEGPHALPGRKSSSETCRVCVWFHKRMAHSHKYRENMATSPRLYMYIYIHIPGTQFWPVFWLLKAFFWRVEAPKHIIIEDNMLQECMYIC